MRGKSHQSLGRYLAERYLSDIPERHVRAFLAGCIQPDRNPVTYLKGSLRKQWLRGHNYENAKRYMFRIARRLESKNHWTLWDYYTLGKLIHYTADAFTYAHNETFPASLSQHQTYENALQEYFLSYLRSCPRVKQCACRSAYEAIHSHHLQYRRERTGIFTDARFAHSACCCVLSLLLPPGKAGVTI